MYKLDVPAPNRFIPPEIVPIKVEVDVKYFIQAFGKQRKKGRRKLMLIGIKWNLC